MCGVVGLFHPIDARAPEERRLRGMTDAIAHRGPDGDGFHTEAHLGFGHRRLSIVDLAGGAQPMFSPDGQVVVTFNGEIYNHAALRPELEAHGHVFRTRSDTESIIHGWRQWGVGVLDRLDGMFAFGLWDRAQGTLLLARDRMGEKPLLTTWLPDGTLAFASEQAALFALPEVSRALSPAAVDDYLAFGYVPDPATIHAAISRLPAAHYLLVTRGEKTRPQPRRYWQPPTRVAEAPAEPVAELTARLEASVRARLMADVPLGAFLSGGVDSGAIVALAATARREAGQGQLATFTIGFEGAADERPLAAEVAARYGCLHQAETGTADYISAARDQAKMFGEPFGDHSSVPTLAVCALARRHATVALSGDGGDEVFGGYRRYRFHAITESIRQMVPAGLRRRVIGPLARAYPKLDWAPRWLRAKNTLTELSLESALGYYRTVCKIHDSERRALLSGKFRASLDGHDPSDRIAALMAECDPDEPLLAAQYVDLHTYLPGDILPKVDRMAMAVSLEVRPPLLDPALVSWGMALPASLKISATQGKQVLRDAMAPLLPENLLNRPKTGFATSLAPQFRAGAAQLRERLLGPAMLDSGLFSQAALARMIDQHANGQFDHAQKLWQLLVFEGFLHHQGAGAAASPAYAPSISAA
jgi:asparagine synthase (glutamine-hydrolysing)